MSDSKTTFLGQGEPQKNVSKAIEYNQKYQYIDKCLSAEAIV